MDSTQSGIIPPSTSKSGTAQNFGSEPETSSETGFSRLFSIVQNKAEKLVDSYSSNSKSNGTRGDSRPEFGKDLPLKYATTGSVKPKTAVLSTNEERSVPGVIEIPALSKKLNVEAIQGNNSASEVPVIHLPQLGDEEIAEPVSSLQDISGENLPADANIPSIAPAGKIIVKQNAISNELAVASTSTSAENSQSDVIAQTQPTAVVSQPTSTVTVDTKIAESAAEVTGITGMNRDLMTGEYGASTEVINQKTEKAAPANISAIRNSPQVEISQLEMRSANIPMQTTAEKPLVDAAFQRQVADVKAPEMRAAEVKPADIGAIEVKADTARPVSELIHDSRITRHQEQPQPEVKPEAIVKKPVAVPNQSFQDLWEKANPVQELNGKNRIDLVPGARPVSELSRSSMETILPAGAIESPLSTKPSLATQPLFSVSSSSTSMPAPTLNMRQGGWETSLAQNVSWMTGNNLKTLQVNITPAELGPIHIHASMEKDKLNLHINAQHGVTRETLEAAVPRLRDILSEGNFTSVNVDVSNDGPGQRQFAENENIEEFQDKEESDSAYLSTSVSQQNHSGSKIGLVDTFA